MKWYRFQNHHYSNLIPFKSLLILITFIVFTITSSSGSIGAFQLNSKKLVVYKNQIYCHGRVKPLHFSQQEKIRGCFSSLQESNNDELNENDNSNQAILLSSSKATMKLETVVFDNEVNLVSNQTNNNKNKNDNTNDNNNDNNDISAIQSILLLNFVAVIWGTQHSFIKMAIEDNDASAFTFTRFAIAATIATIGPLISSGITKQKNNTKNNNNDDLGKKRNDDGNIIIVNDNHNVNGSDDNIAWRWGIEMGLWMLLGYAFQAIGLEYTTAQRSGFLLYLNIKLVPLFAYLIYQRHISVPTWVSALTALSGTALLTFDGSTYDFNIGDAWSIAAAGASAMFILRLEFASKAVSNSAKLNSYSLWVVTIAALLWCIIDVSINVGRLTDIHDTSLFLTTLTLTRDKVYQTISSHPIELIYLGGVSTALANYIQTKAQKGISAERASIIYALDPVYGAFFAYALLGEQLSSWGVIGAALITIAAATNAFLDLGDKQ